MSVQLKLLRTSESTLENPDSIAIAIEQKNDQILDLYKVFHDLLVVLCNSTTPYENTDIPGYKGIMGNRQDLMIGYSQCVGFLSKQEVKDVYDWLKKSNLGSESGFFKHYEKLSETVRQELIDLSSPSRDDLFTGYISEIINFYQNASSMDQSIIVYVE